MTRRDKDATWPSLGTLCRERGWSKRRSLYELQNGLPYRTFPPGHTIDWHDPKLEFTLNVEASEVLLGVSREGRVLIVGIEVLPPTDTEVSASSQWAIATTRRLRDEHKIPKDVTKAALGRLFEAEAKDAVKAGKIRHALKASYLEDQLVPWGIWPLSSFK